MSRPTGVLAPVRLGQPPAASVHVKRVRFSGGASPPGRRPRRTSKMLDCVSRATAERTGPRPKLRQSSGKGRTRGPALRPPRSALLRRARLAAARRRRRQSPAPPLTRSREGGLRPSAPAAESPLLPVSRSGAPVELATQAASSSAAQSCSAPPKATKTGDVASGGSRSRDRRSPISQGASSSSTRRASESRPAIRSSGQSVSSRSMSCSVAVRNRSRVGLSEVNAAVRAATPRSASCPATRQARPSHPATLPRRREQLVDDQLVRCLGAGERLGHGEQPRQARRALRREQDRAVRRLNRHRHRAARPGRREVRRHTVADELGEPLGLSEILEPVHAQVEQPDPLRRERGAANQQAMRVGG